MFENNYLGYKDPISKNRIYNSTECAQLKGTYNSSTKNCTVYPTSSTSVSLSTACKNAPYNELSDAICIVGNGSGYGTPMLTVDSNNNYIKYWTKNDCKTMGGSWVSKLTATYYENGDPVKPIQTAVGTCTISTLSTPSAASTSRKLSTECVFNPANTIITKGTNIIKPVSDNLMGKGICPTGLGFININLNTNNVECSDLGNYNAPFGNYSSEFTFNTCPNNLGLPIISNNNALCKTYPKYKHDYDMDFGIPPIHDGGFMPFGAGNSSILKILYPFEPDDNLSDRPPNTPPSTPPDTPPI